MTTNNLEQCFRWNMTVQTFAQTELPASDIQKSCNNNALCMLAHTDARQNTGMQWVQKKMGRWGMLKLEPYLLKCENQVSGPGVDPSNRSGA